MSGMKSSALGSDSNFGCGYDVAGYRLSAQAVAAGSRRGRLARLGGNNATQHPQSVLLWSAWPPACFFWRPLPTSQRNKRVTFSQDGMV